MPDEKPAARPGTAVHVPLQGGGKVIFTCTADMADAIQDLLQSVARERRTISVPEIIGALEAPDA